MPNYAYECNDCSHYLEKVQSFSEDALKTCPKCEKDSLHRLISGGLGFSVKGGGSANNNSEAVGLGGRYIPMDSAEQKFESRMAELQANREI